MKLFPAESLWCISGQSLNAWKNDGEVSLSEGSSKSKLLRASTKALISSQSPLNVGGLSLARAHILICSSQVDSAYACNTWSPDKMDASMASSGKPVSKQSNAR